MKDNSNHNELLYNNELNDHFTLILTPWKKKNFRRTYSQLFDVLQDNSSLQILQNIGKDKHRWKGIRCTLNEGRQEPSLNKIPYNTFWRAHFA